MPVGPSDYTPAPWFKPPSVPDGTPLPEVFRRVCEGAAHTLKVERVGVWLLVNEDRALRAVNLYERSRRQHSRGATLQVADFPRYFRAVAALSAVPSVCPREDPRTSDLRAAYLDPLGISSILDAPLIRDGRTVGVLCFEQVGAPRPWTPEDRDYARATAELLVARMKAAEQTLARSVPTIPIPAAQAERVEALGRLAAGVAHDVRNLFTVVLGCAELIATRPGLPADVVARAGQIMEAVGRGEGLVRELLDFGKETAGAPRVLDVPAAVAAFVPLLQAAVGPAHAVAFTRDPAPGRVLIDRGQLERALLNLLLNARDAMPGGGPIRVHVAPDAGPTGDTPPGAYVRIDVTDSGTGIPAADRDRIFEPFYTTKPTGQGTGLGLALVRRAVERAGGAVRVESEPGKGSTFRLYLPRVAGDG